jgi:hypothetical protein
MTAFRTLLHTVGLLIAGLAGAVALGSQASLWRFGHHLGERIYHINRWLRRKGALCALAGLIMIGLAAVLSHW